MTIALRLITNKELSEGEVCGLRLLECVARVRRASAKITGRHRAEIDADLDTIRALTLRVVARLAANNWGR